MRRLLVPLWALVLTGCQTSGQSYDQQVNSQPLPVTAEDRQRECAFLRQEMARQQSAAGYLTASAANPMQAAIYQSAVRRNLASLETRASNVGCTAAFSNAAPMAPPATPKIQECVSACRANTDRSSEQCFDTCNK